jgi:hypothetical protein
MQYGGRPFPPYEAYEGGTDLTYCLGTENITAAYGGGLEYSRKVKEVLGVPPVIKLEGTLQKTLNYGALFSSYINNILDEGVQSLIFEGKKLIVVGKTKRPAF